MESSIPEWFRVLESARGLGPRFTSVDLALKADLITRETTGQKRDAGVARASAWLAKLRTWGCVKKLDEFVKREGQRTARLYELTDQGRTAEPGTGKLAKLFDAIHEYGKARGGRDEARAWAAVLKICAGMDGWNA